jgi:hypothetical protein
MKYLGLFVIIAGMLTTLGGFGDAYIMIFGGLITFAGSQIYNRQESLPAPKASNQLPQTRGKFVLTDEMILRLAKRFENKLSVDDLVQQTSLTRDQAKARLEELHNKGICQINLDKVEESGKIYYYF